MYASTRDVGAALASANVASQEWDTHQSQADRVVKLIPKHLFSLAHTTSALGSNVQKGGHSPARSSPEADNSSGAPTTTTSYKPGHGNIMPNAITAGDVNGDGDLELVVGTMFGRVLIFKGFHDQKPWLQSVSGLGTIMAVAVGTMFVEDTQLETTLKRHCIVAASAEGRLFLFDVPWSSRSARGEGVGGELSNRIGIEPVITCDIPYNAVAIAIETSDAGSTLLIGSDDGHVGLYSFVQNEEALKLMKQRPISPRSGNQPRSSSPVPMLSSVGEIGTKEAGAGNVPGSPGNEMNTSFPSGGAENGGSTVDNRSALPFDLNPSLPCYVGKVVQSSLSWTLEGGITSFCQMSKNCTDSLKSAVGLPRVCVYAGLKKGGYAKIDLSKSHNVNGANSKGSGDADTNNKDWEMVEANGREEDGGTSAVLEGGGGAPPLIKNE